jgi:hypothetical protein
MAMTGPSPKSDADRTRRNAPAFQTDVVRWDGVIHGPTLPKGRTWCDDTKRWWLTWRKSDQSMLMTATDWEFMLETALIHNRLHKPYKYDPDNPNNEGMSHTAFGNLMAELRQRMIQFGATYEARKKLHLDVVTPQSNMDDQMADPVAAVAAVDYSARLAGK